MKRLLSLSAILAMVLVLDSCGLIRRTMQVPARMMRAGVRTMTTSVESPEAQPARVAVGLATEVVR